MTYTALHKRLVLRLHVAFCLVGVEELGVPRSRGHTRGVVCWHRRPRSPLATAFPLVHSFHGHLPPSGGLSTVEE